MSAVSTVDEYIAQAPEARQGMLRELRATIKEIAPEAEEKISYGMPYYYYKGRLAYFLLAKHYLSIYIPTPVLEEHQRELQIYQTTDATLRLPLDQPLPLALIKKLIVSRLQKNDAEPLP